MDGAVGHRQVSGAPIVLEACLDSLDLATAAAAGGAGRIELCDRLDVGGTTPSAELVRAVTSVVDIPVCPIIRPRGGDFVYSASEMETMKREVAAMRDLGAAGIVVGILTRGNEVDHPAMRAIIDAADGLPVGFHLAFELVTDRLATLEVLIDLGVERVLTRGGGATAAAGADGLRALVERAANRIAIMAGGSVREHNVAEVVRRGGVREIHTKGLAIAEILARANAAAALSST